MIDHVAELTLSRVLKEWWKKHFGLIHSTNRGGRDESCTPPVHIEFGVRDRFSRCVNSEHGCAIQRFVNANFLCELIIGELNFTNRKDVFVDRIER